MTYKDSMGITISIFTRRKNKEDMKLLIFLYTNQFFLSLNIDICYLWHSEHIQQYATNLPLMNYSLEFTETILRYCPLSIALRRLPYIHFKHYYLIKRNKPITMHNKERQMHPLLSPRLPSHFHYITVSPFIIRPMKFLT